jgi:hypothetical protein
MQEINRNLIAERLKELETAYEDAKIKVERITGAIFEIKLMLTFMDSNKPSPELTPLVDRLEKVIEKAEEEQNVK